MRRLPTSLALLSAALIGYQLVLMQLLSIAQWHHFAYMIISIALLGFGASGTAISLARSWFLSRFDLLVPALMMLSGAAMPAAAALSQSGAARFDSYVFFADPAQSGDLLLTYGLLFIPFFLGALAVGLILVRYAKMAGSFYFANLAGSGAGAVAAPALMWLALPSELTGIIGIVSIGAGIMIIPRRFRLWLVPGAIASSCVCLLLILRPPEVVHSQYKDLSKTLDLPGARVELTELSPYGLVQVVGAPALRYAPGLSLTYTGQIPIDKAIFNNGNWFGPVPAGSGNDDFHLLRYTTAELPYAPARPDSVLVLSAGTCDLAAHALSSGASHVVAVEPHERVLGVLRNELAAESDSLLHDPRVSVQSVEPRTFLAGTDGRFDVIVLPVLGSFGGSIGLFALQEQYELTVEAFREMWRHLTPDGVIAVTVWMDYPYRNPLKAVATAAEMLRRAQVESPRRHLAAVRSWGTMTLIVSKSKIDSAATNRIRSFAARMSFDPVLLPDLRAGERTAYNALQDTTFFELVDRAISGDTQLASSYAFDIRPATDDRPYFSQFLRWQTLPALYRGFGRTSFPFIELGTLIACVTLLQALLAAVLLIILPMRSVGWREKGKWWTLVYFSGLGIGFMFVEIVLIQRFVLYLGHPIYAMAAVVGGILIFSGIGSRLSDRFRGTRVAMPAAAGCAGMLILAYAFAVTPFINSTVGLPVFWKVPVALAVVGIPAVFMGMPFPLGLRYLTRRRRSHVPWAWAINGCVSVVSAALAALLAVQLGFTAVTIAAAAGYAAAALSALTQS